MANNSEKIIAAKFYSDGGYNFWDIAKGVTIYDVATDDLKKFLDPHWYKFPAIHPLWYYSFGLVYTVFGIIAIFGNITVLRIFSKFKSLRSPANCLIMNLAIADLCLMLSMMPECIINFFLGGPWIFGKLACEIHGFSGALFGYLQMFTLTVISWDRYNVIVNGVSGNPLTYQKAISLILFGWIYSTAWAVCPFVGWGGYAVDGILATKVQMSFWFLEGFGKTYPTSIFAAISVFCQLFLLLIWYLGTSRQQRLLVADRWNSTFADPGMQSQVHIFRNIMCSFDYITRSMNNISHIVSATVVIYFIPLMLIIHWYSKIVLAVVHHERQLREQAKKMNVQSLRSNQEDGQSAEIRIAKVSVTTVSLWVLAWTPFAVITNLGLFADPEVVTPLVTSLPSMLAKTSCAYNPLVYAISHPRYRECLKEMYPWICIAAKEKKKNKSDDESVKTEHTEKA